MQHGKILPGMDECIFWAEPSFSRNQARRAQQMGDYGKGLADKFPSANASARRSSDRCRPKQAGEYFVENWVLIIISYVSSTKTSLYERVWCTYHAACKV